MDNSKTTTETVNVCAHCLGGICLQKCLVSPERIDITIQELSDRRKEEAAC